MKVKYEEKRWGKSDEKVGGRGKKKSKNLRKINKGKHERGKVRKEETGKE